MDGRLRAFFFVTNLGFVADRPVVALGLIPDRAHVRGLERVMNLGENRIGMRIPRSAWFLRDLRFPHS
jgi:hypothetical protein